MLSCRRLPLSCYRYHRHFVFRHHAAAMATSCSFLAGVPSDRPILGIVDRVSRSSLLIGLRFASTERSKVEETLRMLKEDIQRQQDEEDKQVKLVPKKDGVAKLPMKTRVWNELKHYWHGFRLLALETRLSSKYLWAVLRGKDLSRRERQQLVRTVSDLFRLVPFSLFIIVPFLEFTLPIFIKLFPNMLPSTFQEASKEEEKLRKQLKVRLEMANFLQDTLEEIGMERKPKEGQDPSSSKAHEFSQFIIKTRTEGGYVSNTELFKFSKLFEDELTLDNLAMSQLRALCRMLGIVSLGSPEILRFQLSMKLRELRADDKQIMKEGGVDELSASDLQHACRARGMRFLGVSEQRLRDQLRQWLELSLNDKVPSSLLLLSRVLTLPEDLSFTDRLKALVAQLPPSVAEQTRQKLTDLEGGKMDYKARLDVIKSIEGAITEEKKAQAEAKAQDEQKQKAKKEKDKEKAEKGTLEQVLQTAQHSVDQVKEAVMDVAAGTIAKLAEKTEAVASKKKLEDAASHVDAKDLESIEDLLHGSPIHEVKHDITELKEKVTEHAEDLIEVGSLVEDYKESKVAKRLRDRVTTMISNVDLLVNKLEHEKRDLDERLDDPAAPDATNVAEQKHEKQVRIADLLESLHRLQKVTDEAKRQRIEQVLKAIDHDTDGVIDANLVLEVIELLGKNKDVKLSGTQMGKIINMLSKEDHVEALDKLQEQLNTRVVNPQLTPKSNGDARSSQMTSSTSTSETSKKTMDPPITPPPPSAESSRPSSPPPGR